MTEPRSIQVYIHSLDALAPLTAADFTARRDYQQYLKQQIYRQRNLHLSAWAAQKINAEDFTQTEFGKPYLTNVPALEFNHSHSQKNYALALSKRIKDIGIDIEDLDRKARFDALARHAFHANELAHWAQCGQDSAYWFKVWTAKEAVLKAAGLGIRINLNELNTGALPEQDGGICTHPAIGSFAYQNFQLANIMLTVAWRTELSCKGFAFPKIVLEQC